MSVPCVVHYFFGVPYSGLQTAIYSTLQVNEVQRALSKSRDTKPFLLLSSEF
jgi:hypothetical protein